MKYVLIELLVHTFILYNNVAIIQYLFTLFTNYD